MNSQTPKQPGCSPRVLGWVLAGAVAITALYVFTEHRVHVALVLPYLLLLACPLMHLFMHRGHRHAHGDEAHGAGSHDESGRVNRPGSDGQPSQ